MAFTVAVMVCIAVPLAIGRVAFEVQVIFRVVVARTHVHVDSVGVPVNFSPVGTVMVTTGWCVAAEPVERMEGLTVRA